MSQHCRQMVHAACDSPAPSRRSGRGRCFPIAARTGNWRHGSSLRRVHRALHPDPRLQGAGGRRLGPRDMTAIGYRSNATATPCTCSPGAAMTGAVAGALSVSAASTQRATNSFPRATSDQSRGWGQTALIEPPQSNRQRGRQCPACAARPPISHEAKFGSAPHRCH
jgi:hypothetical protein